MMSNHLRLYRFSILFVCLEASALMDHIQIYIRNTLVIGLWSALLSFFKFRIFIDGNLVTFKCRSNMFRITAFNVSEFTLNRKGRLCVDPLLYYSHLSQVCYRFQSHQMAHTCMRNDQDINFEFTMIRKPSVFPKRLKKLMSILRRNNFGRFDITVNCHSHHFTDRSFCYPGQKMYNLPWIILKSSVKNPSMIFVVIILHSKYQCRISTTVGGICISRETRILDTESKKTSV